MDPQTTAPKELKPLEDHEKLQSYLRKLNDSIRNAHDNLTGISGLKWSPELTDPGVPGQCYRACTQYWMSDAEKELDEIRKHIGKLQHQEMVDCALGRGLSSDEANNYATAALEHVNERFEELCGFHQEVLNDLPHGDMETPDADGVYSILANYETKIANFDSQMYKFHKIKESILPELANLVSEPRILRTKEILVRNLDAALDRGGFWIREAEETLQKASEEQIIEVKRGEGLPSDMALQIAKDTMTRHWGVFDARAEDLSKCEDQYEVLVKENGGMSRKSDSSTAPPEDSGEAS